VEGLRALPGIGRYTSAAVAAIAFGIPVVPIDGNISRVVSRVFAIEGSGAAVARRIDATAQRLIEDDAARARPGDFTQALFDLGASICTSRNPSCLACPWADSCVARQKGRTAELPGRPVKPARPIRHGAHFWLTDAGGNVLLRRRPSHGLLGGMLELPGSVWRETAWNEREALGTAPVNAAWRPIGTVRHVFTHFELRLDVFGAAVARIEAPGLIAPIADLGELELSSLMRKCVRTALAS
jgi:A/G-specific adenine glycosylase